MTENVLKELIAQGLSPQVIVEEAIPSKGKPARKAPGSITIFIVNIHLEGKESVVEASRGGPREWSDFNKLVKWLKGLGIHNYKVNLSDPEEERAVRHDYFMRRFGIIEKSLYRCAGASLEGLSQCPESEHRKYGFIGAIILLTSLFAMFSGGYALFYIFQSKLYAAIFALLWGMFILNLDRFIVSSMRKSDNFWREFFQALPRLTLALLIAICIARPLEIGIFAEEIESFLIEQKGIKKVEVLKEFNTYIGEIKQGFNTRISEETTQLEQYRAERASTCSARDKAHARYLCERDGTCGTSEKGYGPEAEAKRKRYELLERECTELTARTTELQKRVNSLHDAFDRGLSGSITEAMNDDDVLALEETSEINRLKEERDKRLREVEQGFSTSFSSMNSALWALQKADYSVMAISLVIGLMFIVIEASPITVKLLSHKGPYDYYLDFERDSAEAKYLRGRDNLYEEKGTEFQREMEHLERQKQVETFKAFQDAKAPLEKEMLGKMLDEWKENTELSGDNIEHIGSGLKRMIDDYSRINTTRSEEDMEPLPMFQYPPSSVEAQKEQSEEEESSSGMGSIIKRFLIVPMTFMVTVVSFMMAIKFHAPISPYLVVFISGLLYLTLCIVYFSMKDKRLRNLNEE
jgi:hypothetical protein